MPQSSEKSYFLETSRYTLTIARASDGKIEAVRECAIDNKPALEEALTAIKPSWQVDGIRVVASISPSPTSWYLASSEEARRTRAESAIRSLLTGVSHGIAGDVELAGCNAEDGTTISPTGASRWVVAFASKESVENSLSVLKELKIETERIESAGLSRVGAIAASLKANNSGPVILWDLGPEHSQIILVTKNGVEGVSACAVTLDTLFSATQAALGLKFKGAAARIFFNETYDFSQAGPKIAATISEGLKNALTLLPQTQSPPALTVLGITGKQFWFVKEAAAALSLPTWEEDPKKLAQQLQVEIDTTGGETAKASGLVHLVSAFVRRSGAWHPAWIKASSASRSATLPSTSPFSDPVATTKPAARPAAALETKAPAPKPTPPPERPSTPAPAPKQTAPEAAPAATKPKAAATPIIPMAPPLPTPAPGTPVPFGGLAVPKNIAPAPAAPKPVPAVTSPAPKPAPAAAPKPANPISVPPFPAKSAVAEQPAASKASSVKLPSPVVATRSVLPYQHSRVGLYIGICVAAVVVIAGSFAFLYWKTDKEKTEALEREQIEAQARDLADKRAADELRKAKADAEEAKKRTDAALDQAVATARQQAAEQERQRISAQLELERIARLPGTVVIATSPAGASVSIDGASPQVSPATIKELSPGSHSVHVELANYEPLDFKAQVTGSKTTDLGVLPLQSVAGSIDVTSTPDGLLFTATKAFDLMGTSSLSGKTPATLKNILPGDYVFTFTRDGWANHVEKVSVLKRTKAQVVCTYSNISLQIVSEPTGATVKQDGHVLGTTPLTLTDITPDQTMGYDLYKVGYDMLHIKGAVTEGSTLKLTGVLLSSSRIEKPSEIKQAPKPYTQVQPDLTLEQHYRGAQVLISLVVGKDGTVSDVRVEKTTDKKIGDRCAEAAAKWKFTPGLSYDNQPVNVRVQIPFNIAAQTSSY